jgi:hypothetical protein
MEEAFGGTPIATRLDEDVHHVAVLIDGAPEIVLLTLNGYEELIQVPRVAQPTLSPLERAGVPGTELQAPQSDGLVSNHDPPLCQEIFDITEAQAEAVVEPNGVADDLWWESVSAVAGYVVFHRASLPVAGST